MRISLVWALIVAWAGALLMAACGGAGTTAPPSEAPVSAPTPTDPPTLQSTPTATATRTAPAATVVTFPDENLAAAVREALRKPAGNELTATELAELTELDAVEMGIADLTGIENLSNLTDLNLPGNRISDISALASLTNLTDLNLFDNQISDISALAVLTNLTYLSLHTNQISDIFPLASLTNLTQLFLGFNQISDISPLSALSNLTELFIPHNQISDISPLASLSRLSEVRLFENQISDISPLVENSGLREGDEVALENNPLDLSEGSKDFENLRQLEERGVRVNPLTVPRTPTTTLPPSPTLAAPETSRPIGTIHQVADEECTEAFGDRCIRTVVTCPGITDATVRLRVTGTGAKGTILLTVGGRGTGWYRVGESVGGSENINGMMDTLLAVGYKLVEVRWVEPGIWEGPGGAISLACRSATVFDWVYENIHQGGFLAAQGNSGGSAQIAFSLAYYGLDEVLDLANLGGGPPPCPISTDGEINKEDQLQCLVEAELWNESREPMLFGNPRLHYPNTIVRFFLGEQEGSADIIQTANAYHEAITSEKSMQIVPNTGHGVHRTKEGAAALITSIITPTP